MDAGAVKTRLQKQLSLTRYWNGPNARSKEVLVWQKIQDIVNENIALRSAGDLVLEEAGEKVDMEWGKVKKGTWTGKRDVVGEFYEVYWKRKMP